MSVINNDLCESGVYLSPTPASRQLWFMAGGQLWHPQNLLLKSPQVSPLPRQQEGKCTASQFILKNKTQQWHDGYGGSYCHLGFHAASLMGKPLCLPKT